MDHVVSNPLRSCYLRVNQPHTLRSHVCHKSMHTMSSPHLMGHNLLCNRHNLLYNRHNLLCNRHNLLCNGHNLLCNRHNLLCNRHSHSLNPHKGRCDKPRTCPEIMRHCIRSYHSLRKRQNLMTFFPLNYIKSQIKLI